MPPLLKKISAETDPNLSLGKLVAIHRRRRLGWIGFGAFVLMGAAIVLAPLFYGFYRYYYGYTQHGPVAASAWSRSWYLITLLGLVIFAILILNNLKKSRQSVAIYTKGMRIRANNTLSIPWVRVHGLSYSTVQPYFLSSALRPRAQAYLFLEDGSFIRLDHRIEKFDLLVDRIRKILHPILNARIQEHYNNGKWVEFGSVMVNLTGAKINHRDIPWQDIHRMSIKAGSLVVELANQTAISIPIVKIPNLELMLQIVQAGINA